MTGKMRLIIDSDGSIFSAYDEVLIARWGYPDPDFDLPSFAIRNLGAIDVSVDEQNILVTFRWLTVKPEALSAATQLLGQLPTREVIVRCETRTWIDKTFATPEDAVEWIEANRKEATGAGARTMVSTPRQLRSLSDRPLSRIEYNEDRLALMFKKWRLAQGVFNGDVATFLIQFGLFDRTLVVAESPSDSALVFEHSGTAFTLYDNVDKLWNFRMKGSRVLDQPDPDYGRSIERTYRGVIDERQPRFEYVDAVIQAKGGEPYRYRYDRLLLPWQSSHGRRMVTGTSYTEHADRVVS